MVIRNERQALCVAVEMERRAIRVYERALMLTADPAVQAGIRSILQDEKEHFRRFSEMKDQTPPEQNEEQLIAQALGAEALFTGGVMEMQRAKALSTLEGLYAYAADSEANAIENYLSFAQKCRDEKVAEAFRAIAAEESTHYAALQDKQ